MRRLLIVLLVLLVLVGLLLAVDQWVASTAERRAEDLVSEELGAPADVELRGFPVGLRVLMGSVSEAVVRAEDVPVQRGPRIERLVVRLTDVQIARGGGVRELPRAETATFAALVAEEHLRELVTVPASVLDITLEEGRARIELLGRGVPADVVAEGGNVVLRPRDPIALALGLGRIPIDLSRQTGRPEVREVEVREDALVLRGVLREFQRETGETA